MCNYLCILQEKELQWLNPQFKLCNCADLIIRSEGISSANMFKHDRAQETCFLFVQIITCLQIDAFVICAVVEEVK